MSVSSSLSPRPSQLLDEQALRRTLRRLAHEVAERHRGLEDVVLAGIRTRGVPLAERLARQLSELGHRGPRLAALEIDGYRDDRPRDGTTAGGGLRAADGRGPVSIEGHVVIVVDDVLCTGRTLRAALDALTRQGRAACVELLVVVDRGHRELPVRATYVGKNVPTRPAERVAVRLTEVDGVDGAWLQPAGAGR